MMGTLVVKRLTNAKRITRKIPTCMLIPINIYPFKVNNDRITGKMGEICSKLLV